MEQEHYYVKIVLKSGKSLFLSKAHTKLGNLYSYRPAKDHLCRFASKEDCNNSIKEFLAIKPTSNSNIERTEIIIW